MRFVADANVDMEIIRWLRTLAHDVVYAADFPPAYPDTEILSLANREKRILITFDRDFGDLVFRRKLASEGVLLLRLQFPLQKERLETLKALWPSFEKCLLGHFIVVSNHKVRIRPLP